jgi:hypothetical protein
MDGAVCNHEITETSGMVGAGGSLQFFGVFLRRVRFVCSSEPPLDPALQHAVETHKEIVGEAQKYAYTERVKAQNFDSRGKVTSSHTELYEIIFLEGAPYQKHILHNDKPLDEKEQKAEDKKL